MRKLTRLLIGINLVFLSLLTCGIAFGQLSDPGLPGPYGIVREEYNFGETSFTPTGFPAGVEVIGSVHYPEDLSGGPFPLVVFLHGRHYTCYLVDGQVRVNWPCDRYNSYEPIWSYQGHDYIAEVLASHGYIVVSISANGISVFETWEGVPGGGMLARAELLQHHLSLWYQFNTTGGEPFGTRFVGKVDLNRVGTMGHSRGGEGVVTHQLLNKDQGYPYGINAVMLLAPTNEYRREVFGVPLGVILPYCDGDVFYLGGAHYFDDAAFAFAKRDVSRSHMILAMGANHNFYNTVWTPSLFPFGGASDDWIELANPSDSHCGNVEGNQRLTEDEQRGSGLAYIVAFFRTYLGNETKFLPILMGDRPPPASAKTDDIFVTPHSPDLLSYYINRLENEYDLTHNFQGGEVTQWGLTPYDLCGGEFPEPKYCILDPNAWDSFNEPHTFRYFVPEKSGLSQLRLGWDIKDAFYHNSLPAGRRDISDYQALQFRVAVNYEDTRNTSLMPQDFSVILWDGHKKSAVTTVGRWSKALFYPPGDRSAYLPKVLLNAVRIPLSAFTDVADIDLTNILSIEFSFEQRATGALLISDIVFTEGSFLGSLSRLRGRLRELLVTIQNKQDARKLREAIEHLDKAVEPSLWLDDNRLDPKHGEKVFDETKDAVNKLQELLKNGVTVQAFIDSLVGEDMLLAQGALNDAIAAHGNAMFIAKAWDQIAKAQQETGKANYAEVAIQYYRGAWKEAQKAIKFTAELNVAEQ
jgi:hypothetical protein